MDVRGVDFTSRPSRAKAITCAYGTLDSARLTVSRLDRFASFDGFSGMLEAPGPWIAGIDFPFGQPRALIDNVGWPSRWAEYVALVGGWSRDEFVAFLNDYRVNRVDGDREHLRLVDSLAGARSPMKVYRPPVGLMFYEGAPRLLRSPANIIPVRPTDDDRIVVEAYPALVAQTVVAKAPYKATDAGEAETLARSLRERIVRELPNGVIPRRYGVNVVLADDVARACIDDSEGDSLDAVLAAVQAAWSWDRRHDGYGVPEDCDLLEGWIVDPVTKPSVNSSITRVRPVFQALLSQDSTGASWIPRILEQSPRNEVITQPPVGTLNPSLLDRRSYLDPVQGPVSLERCFEFSVPPTYGFLRFLFENPERLLWPCSGGQRQTFSRITQSRREALTGLQDEQARRAAQDAARRSLDESGVAKCARQWWAFEGSTEVDCYLETERLVLLIEGKRTESLSESTAWYAGRNQLHRNLEAARELAHGREFGVLIIGEEPLPDAALGDATIGLPHLSERERADLMRHYLGCITWRQVCQATGIDFDSLPRNVARRTKTRR